MSNFVIFTKAVTVIEQYNMEIIGYGNQVTNSKILSDWLIHAKYSRILWLELANNLIGMESGQNYVRILPYLLIKITF